MLHFGIQIQMGKTKITGAGLQLLTIKSEKNKRQKARQYFLLGQIYQLLDEPQNAYQAYGKVINQSTPYELELNARIRQTEVTSS